ncbi:SOS response-associated peptidase [Bogoriella caseilytica]|uniref:Abasic site processing protein n=1 Tax=Bogoriella caseilytica TaxID=56055 RepID=A0A3N2BGW7_9MICO|nr:SOS response-associated peptidase [Bogoriella caseilytica]ROR74496.1 putative SOS response-associated peptidase YedK [Bogoriella caseilytica]
MCGRFAQATGDRGLIDAFSIHQVMASELGPSWNVAPTHPAYVILERYEDAAGPVTDATAASPALTRQLRTLRWGLVPSWAKDPAIGSRMINARSETVTEKPSFRTAAGKRRCLVPAAGYYEWQKLGTGSRPRKQPYFLHGGDLDTPPGSEPLLAFAGLYEAWRDPSLPEDHPDPWLRTFTVLTRPATDALGHIHDRSPVLVPRELHGDWLDPDLTEVDSLMAAIPEPHLSPRPVSPAVGNVGNNGAHLIEPIELDGAPPSDSSTDSP